jgi:hypothetical protein
MATFGTWSSGDVLTAADLNAGLPACIVNATSQSFANNTTTVINYDQEVSDPYGWHSTSTNNQRITPNLAGYYLATLECRNWQVINGRALFIIDRNLVNWSRFDVTSTASEGATVSGLMYLNCTTDYVETRFYQNSGSSKTMYVPQLSVIRIGG